MPLGTFHSSTPFDGEGSPVIADFHIVLDHSSNGIVVVLRMIESYTLIAPFHMVLDYSSNGIVVVHKVKTKIDSRKFDPFFFFITHYNIYLIFVCVFFFFFFLFCFLFLFFSSRSSRCENSYDVITLTTL